MQTQIMIALISLLLALPSLHASDTWQVKQAPIMTRWARNVSPESVLPEYPRPQMVREQWLNLNGLWEFAPEQGGPDAEPPIGQHLDRQILVPFPVESALSGIMERHDRIWYRRTFDVPEDWSGKRLLLNFGAVDWEARIWLNGTFIGEHRGGYDAFTFDITDALIPGAQELIVGVWDPTSDGRQPRGKQVDEPKGIWYTPATGIWQTVWLEPVPETYLSSIKLTPDVDASILRVECEVANPPGSLIIDVAVSDGGTAIANASGHGQIELKIPKPVLWSPESPFLYDVRITLRSDLTKPAITDRIDSYFGMRKIAIGPDKHGVNRLLLNDKPLFHIGPLDQGFWPDGIYTAPTDEALRYDIEMTKKLGFNATRKHVKIEPARWYYWCDTLGLLVWQDMPSGDAYVAPGKGEIERSDDSAAQFERELERLIKGFYNHPSIVMWVIFNEGWGQYATARLTIHVRLLDPTRLINSASGWNDRATGNVHDIHSYPGPAAPWTEPNRAIVLGEFGGLGLPVDNHTWTDKAWGYRGTSDAEELARSYERLLRDVWKLKRESGLAAAIYTQITDVETECNGLLTYDRAVCKPDIGRISDANRGRLPNLVTVIPTARKKPAEWKYTTTEPEGDWQSPDYDDSNWKTGPSGFGTEGTPGAVVRTEWNTADIWLRRVLPPGSISRSDLFLYVHHDEDAEIYINGVLAAKALGYTTAYEDLDISKDALAAITQRENVIAVHCRQTSGGQFIDLGFVRLIHPVGD